MNEFLHLRHVKYEGEPKWTLMKEVKILVEYVIDDLKLNDIPILIKFKKPRWKDTSGIVYYKDKWSKHNPFKITIDCNLFRKYLLRTVAHELRHVYQVIKGSWKWDGKKTKWKGKLLDEWKSDDIMEQDCERYERKVLPFIKGMEYFVKFLDSE